jgi:hypothetical protein
MSYPDYALILSGPDKSLGRRCWERIVGVAQGNQFVVVYAPEHVRLKDISCCVAVLDDGNLAIASARANISPLLDLARRHLHDGGPFLAKF